MHGVQTMVRSTHDCMHHSRLQNRRRVTMRVPSYRKHTVTVRHAQLLSVFDTMAPPPASIHGVRRRVARITFTLCRTCGICCTPCDCGIFRHLVGCIFRQWSAAFYARALSCTRLTACIANKLPLVVAIHTTVVTLVSIVVTHVWRAYDTTHV